jgi:hypothetical protein
MGELPEEAIEDAAGTPVVESHSHDGVTAEDGTLADHLVRAHQLDMPETLSGATQEGLHDRLHERSKAADD